jgi:hypothetical protein
MTPSGSRLGPYETLACSGACWMDGLLGVRIVGGQLLGVSAEMVLYRAARK